MKKIILLLSFLLANEYLAHGQNWQTVNTSDTTHYVVNDTIGALTGKLRVIWIDSSKVNGSYTTHYFYPSIRPKQMGLNLNPFMCLDTAGATWMGKTFVRTQDGDELYFNLNSDTIRLKTRATINESWTLFKTAGDTLFQAQVIALDTLSVDGQSDSIKQISIQAYYNNLPIGDLHNNQIILSKEHGFLRTMEWCYFGIYQSGYPYPKMEQAHNRLPEEMTTRNLNSDISKYEVGNEWIQVERTDNMDWSGTFIIYNIAKHSIHDSVISKNQVTNGYQIEFYRRERNTAVINNTTLEVSDDTISYIHSLILDTINSIQPLTLSNFLPEYNRFVMPDLVRFADTINSFMPVDYFIEYGCNSKVGLRGEWLNTAGGLFPMSDSCFLINYPLGNDVPVWLQNIYLEGFGVYYSKGGNLSYIQELVYHNYSNINGCTSGAKYNILLPADVLQLQTVIQRENHIHLEWFTRNEVNVSRFEIQRKLTNGNFNKVGEIKSIGDNALTNEYKYQDPITTQMQGKELQYRIKMIDHDGKAMYSNVIHLNTYKSNDIRVYPNPFKDYIQLDGLSIDMEYQIEITDLAGRVLHLLTATANSNGNILIQDLQTLAAGMYILNLKNDESVLLSAKISK